MSSGRPSRNDVTAGGNVLISMTDDACDHLRCFDTPAATDLKVNAVPIGTGKHGYSIEVVAFAVPAADGYGSVTVKVAPFPTPLLEARIVPPWASTKWRTIANPNPRPLCFRLVVLSA